MHNLMKRSGSWAAGSFAGALGVAAGLFIAPFTVQNAGAQAAWTYYGTGTSSVINKLVWANGQYVFVGDGGSIRTSPDGTAWTARSSSGYAYGSVVWTGAQFVLVGQIGIVQTSPDAVTWTPRTSNSSNMLNGIL